MVWRYENTRANATCGLSGVHIRHRRGTSMKRNGTKCKKPNRHTNTDISLAIVHILARVHLHMVHKWHYFFLAGQLPMPQTPRTPGEPTISPQGPPAPSSTIACHLQHNNPHQEPTPHVEMETRPWKPTSNSPKWTVFHIATRGPSPQTHDRRRRPHDSKDTPIQGPFLPL